MTPKNALETVLILVEGQGMVPQRLQGARPHLVSGVAFMVNGLRCRVMQSKRPTYYKGGKRGYARVRFKDENLEKYDRIIVLLNTEETHNFVYIIPTDDPQMLKYAHGKRWVVLKLPIPNMRVETSRSRVDWLRFLENWKALMPSGIASG
jgi:hypothetical protein